MRLLFTIVISALSLNAIAQTNPNYNPDFDANGVIGVDDLLGFLSSFGASWDSGDVIMGCTYPAAVEYNSSANVDDGSCTFPVDCAGVLNGTSVVDECGVCGGENSCLDACGVPNGDNSTCLDECGVPNGDNSCLDACGVPNGDNSTCLDECGVPNGDNSSCAGCDGVANSGLVIDECGVCGGDNSTCSDECGVPNGDNSSCADCAGVAYGTSVIDDCGVCGGDNSTCSDECGVPNGDNSSCAGCDGVANSGLVIDECGVCGGDNSTCSDECGVPNGDNSSCAGCDGVANSGLVIDECGVCGGDSSCLDACGVPNGDNSTCTDNCGVVNGTNDCVACGEGIEHEGYYYSTVLIGGQCWFAENCRYLPEVSPSNVGTEADTYYYVYGYQGTDVAAAQATSNYATYGVLYNWPAVMTEGICPTGWHIPSDGEWQTMEISLGMSESEVAQTGWRGSPVGDSMKSTSGWNSGGNGTNSSGFTGLPGGYRYSGSFGSSELLGYWWSASESGSNSWGRTLYNYDDTVYRGVNNQSYGFSARCVRD
jgi:uncharacterized protein (TIGR02145 family)